MDEILISFGRQQVMLKDLSDSKRLDSYVHSESGKAALDGVAVDSWYATSHLGIECLGSVVLSWSLVGSLVGFLVGSLVGSLQALACWKNM